MQKPEMIELYGQYSYHDCAVLRLSKPAAKMLGDALLRFAQSEEPYAVMGAMASDGEGYWLHFIEGQMHDDVGGHHYVGNEWHEPGCGDSILEDTVPSEVIAEAVRKETSHD